MADIIDLRTRRKQRERAASGWEPATGCTISVKAEDHSVILELDTPDYTVALALPPDFARKLSQELFSVALALWRGVR